VANSKWSGLSDKAYMKLSNPIPSRPVGNGCCISRGSGVVTMNASIRRQLEENRLVTVSSSEMLLDNV